MRQTIGLIQRFLTAHQPNPALALGRDWTILAMNRAVALLVRDVDPALLQGEVNALRLTLHPQGMAPKILNLVEWRDHILRRLQHDIDLS